MQKWTQAPRPPITIGFLLFDRFSNLCLANCLEPMRAANGFLRDPAYAWRFATLDGAPVASSSHLPVLAQGDLDSLGRLDRLFVLASYDHLAHDTAAMRRLLARAARRCDLVAGLDAGAWLMASAGLLRGRRATIHRDLIDAFGERFLDVEVQQAAYLRDGDRLTCAGAMAAFDMTRAMIRDDLGTAIALDVDGLFLADRPSPQPTPGRGDPLVARAVAQMRGALEQVIALPDLATRLGTTPRTLTRRCQAALGTSPGTLYRHIRLSAARQMVEDTTNSLAEIAVRCGYDDPSALTRAFRARFGTTPQALRRRDAAAVPH